MRTAATILITALLLISSSYAELISRFVGKWKSVENGQVIEFRKNGESLQFIDGDLKYPATIRKDGSLEVSIPDVAIIVFDYNEKADSIMTATDELKRVK